MADAEKIAKAAQILLEAFGEDISRPGLIDTPRRVAHYWTEMLEGMQYSNEEIAQMYGKTFEIEGSPLIVKKVKDVFSHCEHHLALMYDMDVIVAYLPKITANGKSRVLGLSKIPRIVDMCAKRLQLQERLMEDIAECISIASGTEDVYVLSKAKHACVSARGVKDQGETFVECAKGEFLNNYELKDEVRRRM